tara:strand:- start:337 stop:537 length:201 start_codon:yes stop_codon:yes gene_type:complete
MPYMEEFTVFMIVKIPNLKAVSISNPNIVSNDDIIINEIIKINMVKKYLLISFIFILFSENKNLFL